MANSGTFRSAINGFNRQDVMDYLESASQRYEALKKERNDLDRMRTEQLNRVKELEGVHEEAAAAKEQAAQEVAEALEKLRAKEEECEGLLAQQQARAEELESFREEAAAMKEQAARDLAEALEKLRAKEDECEGLRASLETITAERDAALAKPAEDPAVAEELRSEISELKARLTELEASQAGVIQKAAEYDSMRERIATLELNASRRAADIEDAARSEARSMIEQAQQQAEELTMKARQDAEAMLRSAREKEADFRVQREESYRSFRESLHGAAQETEASTGLISDELTRLSEKLKGIVGSIMDTSRRFETAEAPEAEETRCCEAETGEAEACCKNSVTIHHCHE